MKIKRFVGGAFYTNCYILSDEDKKVCCLIDVSHDTKDSILQYLKENELKLEAVFLTHSHFDHFGDLAKLKKELNTKIFVHPLDKQNIITPGSDRIPLMIPTEGVIPDEELKGGQTLHVGSIEIKVIETPGHSPGSVSFFIPKEKALFSGDVIFKGGRGRTDLPGCDEEVLFNSMEKLFGLGDDVVIYSGHGEKTTVQAERNQR